MAARWSCARQLSLRRRQPSERSTKATSHATPIRSVAATPTATPRPTVAPNTATVASTANPSALDYKRYVLDSSTRPATPQECLQLPGTQPRLPGSCRVHPGELLRGALRSRRAQTYIRNSLAGGYQANRENCWSYNFCPPTSSHPPLSNSCAWRWTASWTALTTATTSWTSPTARSASASLGGRAVPRSGGTTSSLTGSPLSRTACSACRAG